MPGFLPAKFDCPILWHRWIARRNRISSRGASGIGYVTGMQGSTRPTVRGRLFFLAAAAFVPLLLIGVWLAVTLLRWNDDEAERRLVAASRTIAAAADAEIEGRRSALLALGSAIQGGQGLTDLAAADATAREAAQALGMQIGILDRGLGMLVDTSQPFGTPLGSTPAVAAGLWAIETGHPRVSDLLPGPAGTNLPPMLLVPLLRDGRAESVLAAPLDLGRLAAAIGPGRVALFDGRGRLVASGGGANEDSPDWPSILSARQGEDRIFTGPQGQEIRFAVTSLGDASDWRAVAWSPASAGPLPTTRILPLVLAGLAAALLAALLAFRTTARTLREPAATLTRHARASAEAVRGDGAAPAVPDIHRPAEFAELAVALADLQKAVDLRERRLRSLAEAGALVLWRADAAGGWTEATGWTDLTGQAVLDCRGDGWIEMVHGDDRAPTLAEWGRSLVARQPIGVEFRLRDAGEAAEWRWVRATGVPVVAEEGTILEWVGAIHDVSDARGAGAAHRVNEAQVRQTVAELRAVYDTVPVGLALVDKDLRFVNVNARFAAIGGLPTESHVGRRPHEVMPDGLAEPLERAQRQVLETGRPVLDVTCAGQAPGAVQNLRHWLASCHPVKDPEGRVTGVSAVLQDVTERVRAERSREHLVTELNHRVKNTLATVQSIAAQSVRRAGPALGGFGRDFVGRLQALTRSHDLLADQSSDRVDFARVAQAGLSPWLVAGRAIRMAGSGRIQVDAGQAQALVLALHELATNALKYGALSRPGGEVEASWSLGADGMARFEWRESGGPATAPPPPEKRGFGMRLLERGLVHDLGPGAEVTLAFHEDGLQAVMQFRAGVPALIPVATA